LVVYNVGAVVFPESIVKAPEFANRPIEERLGLNWIVMFIFLLKYIGIWLLAEGSIIISGLGFNGYEEGHPKWDGLSNIRPFDYIFATNHQQIINSFNINTNDWVKRYIFKRLKGFDNRHVSSVSTLLFLSIWHGFFVGYFLCFGFEFVYMEAEKKYQELTQGLNKLVSGDGWFSKGCALVYAVFCWILRTFGMHFALIPFVTKTWASSIVLLNCVYWYGLVVCMLIILAHVIIRPKKIVHVPAPRKIQ